MRNRRATDRMSAAGKSANAGSSHLPQQGDLLFEARDPLYANVISRTIAAETEDPRFPKVRPDELDDIKLEISVLTPPGDLAYNSPEDLLEKLEPLRDGVIITTRYGSSTFLPQVWEQLPGKEQFLEHLCRKNVRLSRDPHFLWSRTCLGHKTPMLDWFFLLNFTAVPSTSKRCTPL